MMKTRVCRLYGENDIRIEIDDVATPGPGQVLMRIGAGGICGSDLHYYRDGGFGPIRVREPIILGHEIAGVVEAAGPGVELSPGDKAALNPSRPCGDCRYCREVNFQHCLAMRFYGSAMPFPHEQGAFRDLIVAEAAQCVRLSPETSLTRAACAEPLAVCLHARNRAGELRGKKALVTGAGPIGCLVAAAAAMDGAAEIVATDLHDAPLAAAAAMGATGTINVRTAPDAMAAFAEGKGYFDLAFECSAAAPALRAAIDAVRPLGRIVQVGVTGELPIPINLLVAKEIELVGTHRFHGEFREAARLIDRGEVDPTPILTGLFPLERAVEAFELAGDRQRAVKVQLSFADA
jgi:L-idonate 5-dehydrogenase